MIRVDNCIAILGTIEGSESLRHFLSFASTQPKMKREGGFRATYSLKGDGIYIHLEYLNKQWTVTGVMFLGRPGPRWTPFHGDIGNGVRMEMRRPAWREILGEPPKTGGDGKPGDYGLKMYVWDRWNYSTHSLRADYEDDESVHLVSIDVVGRW